MGKENALMIYLDSAATSLLRPDSVAQAVCDAIRTMGNSSRGAYDASLGATRIIYETRLLIAALFHCSQAEQVVFTANSTEALNLAIKGIFTAGDHIITTALEHNSVLRPLYEMEAHGARLTILPADAAGKIDYEAMEAAVCKDTRGIVCTHASNVTGNLMDIDCIGEICKKNGILFILDASQTAGVVPIDMEKSAIDVVCFTGHKSLLGPQGTGGLCVRSGLTIRTWKSGGSGIQTFSKTQPRVMPTQLEAGTLNAHGLAGLRAGLLYIKEKGQETICLQQNHLMQCFYKGVSGVPKVKVYGDFSSFNRAAIVSLNIGEEDSGHVSDVLSQDYAICTRPGGHCAPLMHEAFGTVQQGMVRFSFSHLNTKNEVDQAVQAICELAEE
jgi:cysteine desulfurase family protein